MTIAFLDLETTGLVDPHILEIATVLTDDNLVPFAERSLLVDPRDAADAALGVDQFGPIKPRPFPWSDLCEPEAFRMHTDNGLLAEIDERQPGGAEMAQEALLDWLTPFVTLDNLAHVPLAGFGVGRYDVPLLARWMPELLARFHYRTIDVRTLTEVTRRWADFGGAPEQLKGHRALADCHDAIATLRWWRNRYMPDRSGAQLPAPHQVG